jgi:phosphohistidine phosphatase
VFVISSDRPEKILQLVRHAKSSWADSSLADIDRPLSGRGKRGAQTLAQHVAETDERPDVVWCSPAKRARQTMAAIRGALGSDVAIRIEPVVYEAGPDELLGALRDLPPDAAVVMVIGHNPTLQDLALRLIDPDGSAELARLQDKFPTGAMATLLVPQRWDLLATACARLQSLWTPR